MPSAKNHQEHRCDGKWQGEEMHACQGTVERLSKRVLELLRGLGLRWNDCGESPRKRDFAQDWCGQKQG